MPRPRPRNAHRLEPQTPAKTRCKRGHLLRQVGWVLSTTKALRGGGHYRGRRCKACLRDDVAKHKRRKMKNEKTGRAAGSAAGRVARAFAKIDGRHRVYICRGGAYTPVGVKAGDIKSAASSALTQRPDRPKAASTNPKRRTRRK